MLEQAEIYLAKFYKEKEEKANSMNIYLWLHYSVQFHLAIHRFKQRTELINEDVIKINSKISGI